MSSFKLPQIKLPEIKEEHKSSLVIAGCATACAILGTVAYVNRDKAPQVKHAFVGAGQAVRKAVQDMIAAITGAGKETYDSISRSSSSAAKSIAESAHTAADAVSHAATSAAKAVNERVHTKANGVAAAVDASAKDAVKSANKAADQIKEAVKKA